MSGKKYLLYCDGACRGNPGPASIGAVIYLDGVDEPVLEISKTIGTATNNQAEYRSLIEGLKGLQRYEGHHEVRMDSELVVRQILGQYKVKNEGLKPLFLEAREIFQGMKCTIKHVPREQNREADRLANEALDNSSHRTN